MQLANAVLQSKFCEQRIQGHRNGDIETIRSLKNEKQGHQKNKFFNNKFSIKNNNIKKVLGTSFKIYHMYCYKRLINIRLTYYWLF